MLSQATSTKSCSFCYGLKDFSPCTSIPKLKMMTSQAVQGTLGSGANGLINHSMLWETGYKSLFDVNEIIQQTHMVKKSTPRVNLIKFLQV